MGNQLFQLGLLFAIRERRGHEFYLPRDGQSLWACFDLDVPSAGAECDREFYEENGSCNYDARRVRAAGRNALSRLLPVLPLPRELPG